MENENKEPVYYGETVKLGDSNKVLLRWKLDDGQYQVIYGDLHAETVTKEKMKENKPVYYGETVEPGDADKMLLRWKLDDGQYRVIFGDLSVKTITPEELAELENAQ